MLRLLCEYGGFKLSDGRGLYEQTQAVESSEPTLLAIKQGQQYLEDGYLCLGDFRTRRNVFCAILTYGRANCTESMGESHRCNRDDYSLQLCINKDPGQACKYVFHRRFNICCSAR